ncbi:MAG: PspA/IM30 family protein, partial [Lachnospiraceae bacterium]|nr:PspA/IM30 family protein [Lachnospiraceae bacterium]
SGVDAAGNSMAAFDRMEEKINRRLDEVDAMAELNADSSLDSIEELAKKYDSDEVKSDVDDELAALKAELGM